MPNHRARPSGNDSNSWSFSDFFDLLAASLTTPGALNIPAPSTCSNETFGFIERLPHQMKRLLITSYLGDDLPSLIQFSLTSKTNWLLVCSCPRRFLEVELTSSGCAIVYHGRSKHYLYDERFWGPLFEGSEVSRLRLDDANRRLPPLHVDSLDIETADLCTVEILKKYLPKSGKYREIQLSLEVSGEISDELVSFVRDSAEQLACRVPGYQLHLWYKESFRRFQNKRLRFHVVNGWLVNKELGPFHRLLMREWIKGGRHIESITFSFDERTARNIAIWKSTHKGPRRFTEVELTLCGTCAMVFHRRARRCLYNKRFWGPLLQGSNVSKLHLKYPQNFDLPPLHADTLSITWLSPWTGAQLEKYKPKTGKFQEILLSKPRAIRLPIAQDFIDFMRDSAASTTITSR
ncbi:unnamed protein product, partial [Mesorhabditis spiculigera]